jgi:hypothetical protein
MSLQLLKSEYNKHYDYAVKDQNKTEVWFCSFMQVSSSWY